MPSQSLATLEDGYLPDADDLRAWGDLVSFILHCEPRFLRRPSIGERVKAEAAALRQVANGLLERPTMADDADVARNESALYAALRTGLDAAVDIAPEDEAAGVQELARRASEKALELGELADAIDLEKAAESEDGSAWEVTASPDTGVDVAEIFSDF